MKITSFAALPLIALLAACAADTGTISSTPAAADPLPLVSAKAPAPTWPHEASDLPVDPEFRFGQLPNGMRYVIRNNATPQGQAQVRMWVDSGSLAETENELGLAHFVEHMAFNGTTNVPEGEMVKLLEREGLAFGADTNASTGFDRTLYQLDLPRNEQYLLEIALFLMRETASEMTIAPEAVDRERGVVLAELRDRNNFQLRNIRDNWAFTVPDARYPQRLPIGTEESLKNATVDDLRSYYRREYVPANTTVMVVGDFDPDVVEAAIKYRFDNWQSAPMPAEPDPGPIDIERQGLTDLFIDPAQDEQFTASRMGAYIDGPDSAAQRKTDVLRQIGYSIINRRLTRVARSADAPFRSAGVGTGDIFEIGRVSNLVVYVPDGGWQKGMETAVSEYRRAMAFGFTRSEVAEQVANIRNALENGVSGAATRSNAALMGELLRMLGNDSVPTTPASAMERFEAMEGEITPEAVLAAVRDEFVPLENPMLRFEGRQAPEGGTEAIRAAWDAAMAAPLEQGDMQEVAEWGYTDFGPAGEVVSDTIDNRLGIRQLRFANNLRVNLKNTDIEADRVRVQLSIDGGEMLNTREEPLATALVGLLPQGGLGKHSFDDLQSVLAGSSVALNVSAGSEAFVMSNRTTPRDLELQLQLMTAAITDPGFRTEAELQYKRNVRNFFKTLDTTPGRALANRIEGILTDDDPRFALQSEEAYLEQNFAKLKDAIEDRWANGAMELALVGEFDQDEAIAIIARTLGALPKREESFQTYADRRERSFTSDRSLRTIEHEGEPDQAILQMRWPTRDDSDLKETLVLELLQRVTQLELTDSLREELGEAYSPFVSASQSSVWTNYGTFTMGSSLAPDRLDAARDAMLGVLAKLRGDSITQDTLDRARKPYLEVYDNTLKGNSGWMNLVDRAQSESERIDRFQMGKDVLSSITLEEVQAAARKYLDPDSRLEIRVVPMEKDEG